jgi:hypothetical protein
MGPKGRPDTKTNWSTDCRPQEGLRNYGYDRLSAARGAGVSVGNALEDLP